MKYLNVFIVLIPLIVNSCQKKDEYKCDCTLYTIDSSLYPLIFNPGSYWIYQNQDDNKIDSIIITKASVDTFDIMPSAPGTGITSRELYFEASYSGTYSGEYKEQYSGIVISRAGPYGAYLYIASHRIGDKRANAKIANIYDSFSVDGKNYSNVIKMNVTHDFYLNNDMNLYYVDSIGVIKKEIKENDSIVETWNLLRYNVSLYSIH